MFLVKNVRGVLENKMAVFLLTVVTTSNPNGVLKTVSEFSKYVAFINNKSVIKQINLQ